ncbi:SIR2 family protein [Patulibacter sp. SYSU D01012]|uniref:SIR2 family protein n=1 Tax=Patulibacter sp. SYSU D01012 TaxID=2817381 RepID=UPI001B315EE4|nr:SIR2 family protein [Patulibacter sp. SYSU D01012]
MARHLFVTRGDLTALYCDAWVLPTDREGRVTASWGPALAPLGLGRADADGGRLDEAACRDLVATGTAVLRSPSATCPGLVACDTAVAHADVDACARAAERALARLEAVVGAADALPSRALELPRPRPLVGLPTVGVGAGGGRDVRGAVLAGQIAAIRRHLAANDDGPDVVLVCFAHEHYAAVQRARRAANVGADFERALGSDLHDRVRALAAQARTGRLVPFVGAGVSMGAGLPSWVGLIDELVEAAGMEEDRAALDRIDLRDRAALIQSRLGAGELDRFLLDRLSQATRVALQHQLLASLPVHEAVSTNWDDLFERAWAQAGADPVAVLPLDGQTDAEHWIVKLHGTVRDGEIHDVVLTRDDYLRFGAERNALAGIVQALLLTRHMLFVGFGLSDETFHRIAHDVRQALSGPSAMRADDAAYATSLSPSRRSITSELWRGQLDVVSTRRPDDGEGRAGTPLAARRLEIALDAMGMLSVDPLGHLLDPTFDGALTDEEQALALALRRFAREAEPLLGHAGPAGEAVARWLGRMRPSAER